jgi:RNase H-fold protein (predicted Holliday junction resolvase)
LSDGETRLAFGYAVLKNDGALMEVLRKIAAEHDVAEAVIGVPTHTGQKSAEEEIRKFGTDLESALGVKVSYFQEMFTTKMAQANRLERGKMKDPDADDKEAARIILQEWLDSAGSA